MAEEEEIENKVAGSALVNINLEDFYAEGQRSLVDLSHFLDQGLVLREMMFREQVKNEDWSKFNDHYVAVTCSTDAIVPAWAYMLVASRLEKYARKVICGDLELLETALYREALQKVDVKRYRDKPVIINGCGKRKVPESAYVEITTMLKPVVKSLMYGEACSTVPVYKRKPVEKKPERNGL